MNTTYKILVLLALFLTASLQLLIPQSNQYKFRHITANDGLPAPSVNSIVKDKHGFIWLATGIGLYRYDGYNFKEYRSNPSDSSSLSSNLLTAQLFLDKSGDLWVGTKDRGLNQFNIVTEKNIRYQYDPNNPKSISSNNLHKVIQDSDGIIWVATLGGGINKFNKADHSFTSFSPEPYNKSDNANFIQAIIEFDNENLLIGTRRSLYLFDKSSNVFRPFTDVYKSEIFSSEEVITDLIYEDSIVWVGTENGLIKYNLKTNNTKRFIANEDDSNSLSSNIIRQLVSAPDNQYLWVSTVWGLNRFDKISLTADRFLYDSNDPNSIGFNMLWGLYIDENKLLWIGTDNAGVNVLNLNKNQFHHISMGGESNSDEQFSAIVFAEDMKDQFWVGTFGGGLWQFDQNNKLQKHFQHQPGKPDVLAGNDVFSLCQDSDGSIWVGTSNGGLNNIKNEKLTRLTIDSGISKNDPTSIIELAIDKQNILWIGTLTGLYYYDKTKRKTIENIGISQLNNTLIRSICVDSHNNLWIGTHGEGLFKLNQNGRDEPLIKNYRHKPDNSESINSDIVMSVFEDNFGNIWIASNHGLNRYLSEKGKFASFDKKNGLDNDYLYHIQGEEKGILWITSALGLIRFNPRADSNKRSRLFEFNQEVPFEDIYPYSFYLRRNGEICIGGKSGSSYGYYRFHPDSITDNKVIPKISITSLKVKNEDYKPDSILSAKKALVLNHDQNFLTFEFSALDFTNLEKNQYAYFLDGFETEWNYVDHRHFANYTGVPPGKYVFRVKGSNNDGYWNEAGTSIILTILPPPWKTWWAYLSYIFVSIGILFSIFYYYTHRQKLLHELRHLEEEKKMMAARSLIEGQEDERRRIAKELHDGLGVLLSAAKIQVSSIKLDNLASRSLINKASSLLDQAAGDVRKISHNMMPGLLTKFGLYEAIRDLTDKISEGEQLSASCTINGSEDRLAENTEIMLYRIIQELINNTLKHANADSIKIEIQVLQNQIDIKYSDNGTGFDVTKMLAQKSIGLQSISSRLNFLEGQLNIKSSKGEGTVFHMKIPL